MESTHDLKINWRIASNGALHWRVWQDEAVVYCEHSGDTHLISAAAADLLQSLQQAPSNAAQLAAQLAASWQEKNDQALAADVLTALAGLHALALIEPAAP